MDGGGVEAKGRPPAATVPCIECGCSSGLRWKGWRAYRVDDPELDTLPEIAFFCPACSAREFGVGATGERRWSD